jgi:hypothetical protein
MGSMPGNGVVSVVFMIRKDVEEYPNSIMNNERKFDNGQKSFQKI